MIKNNSLYKYPCLSITYKKQKENKNVDNKLCQLNQIFAVNTVGNRHQMHVEPPTNHSG